MRRHNTKARLLNTQVHAKVCTRVHTKVTSASQRRMVQPGGHHAFCRLQKSQCEIRSRNPMTMTRHMTTHMALDFIVKELSYTPIQLVEEAAAMNYDRWAAMNPAITIEETNRWLFVGFEGLRADRDQQQQSSF